MKSISLKTYAKINISLDVTGVREDGYHEVCMVMQAVDLHDEMTVRLMEEREPDIVLKSNRYYVPTDERNTAFKAARLMLDLYDSRKPEEQRTFGVRIDIGKEIPVAAGLAGGSSNAAGAIVALNDLLELRLSLEEMCAVGSRVGADVPFSILSLLAALKQDMKVTDMQEYPIYTLPKPFLNVLCLLIFLQVVLLFGKQVILPLPRLFNIGRITENGLL